MPVLKCYTEVENLGSIEALFLLPAERVISRYTEVENLGSIEAHTLILHVY